MKGLVLNLKMRDKQGSVVTDYSRYGNNGAVNGGAEWVEKGMRFDGSSSDLDCGIDPSLDVSQITVSLWVNPNSASNYGPFVDKMYVRSGQIDGYGVGSDGELEFGNGSTNYKIGCGFTIDLYEWLHYVVTYENGTAKFYKDGVLKTEDTSASGDIASSDKHLYIGRRGGATIYYYNGSIDDVRIYNYALSFREIKAYYNSTRHNYD